MKNLIINGGKKLHGEIQNQSSKNAAEAVLCASLLVKGKVLLQDVPQIESVGRILDLLRSIGVKAEVNGNTVSLDTAGELNLKNLDKQAAETTRASLLLFGALAGRVKKYKLYKSGGCHLGERTVRPHLFALEKLGIEIEPKECYYDVRNTGVKKFSHIVLYESGDTTTENVIMAAVLAQGITTVKMASANYMVQDLCYFLNQAGAKISGIGTTTLIIEGVDSLHSVDGYWVMPDPIVAMTLISVAITTGSRLTVTNCPLEFLELELCKLEVMGQKFNLKNERWSTNGKFKIVDIEIMPSELNALPDKIYGRPFPGLNIDNLPLFIPILTQAKGRSLVHDWAYENRAVYSLDLVKLGAKITLLDPHRLWVEGPTKFEPAEIVCPPAIRPAMNILICMLATNGQSVLKDAETIDRGYEKNFYDLLNKAGAEIERSL